VPPLVAIWVPSRVVPTKAVVLVTFRERQYLWESESPLETSPKSKPEPGMSIRTDHMAGGSLR
jgi:hypothetical protein